MKRNAGVESAGMMGRESLPQSATRRRRQRVPTVHSGVGPGASTRSTPGASTMNDASESRAVAPTVTMYDKPPYLPRSQRAWGER